MGRGVVEVKTQTTLFCQNENKRYMVKGCFVVESYEARVTITKDENGGYVIVRIDGSDERNDTTEDRD